MTKKDEAPPRRYQNDIPPCMIFVDKEGNWFHKGTPIVHDGFLELFYSALKQDHRGRYIIQFKNQICQLDVEDTPFVVVDIDFVEGKPEKNDHFVLHLIDGSKETLNPKTLFLGPQNVLYCRVRNDVFKARFSRPSYYRFAAYVEEEPETHRFFISLNGKNYYLEGGSKP
jgi:hypothetical protein